jgi:hypothetical protein
MPTKQLKVQWPSQAGQRTLETFLAATTVERRKQLQGSLTLVMRCSAFVGNHDATYNLLAPATARQANKTGPTKPIQIVFLVSLNGSELSDYEQGIFQLTEKYPSQLHISGKGKKEAKGTMDQP